MGLDRGPVGEQRPEAGAGRGDLHRAEQERGHAGYCQQFASDDDQRPAERGAARRYQVSGGRPGYSVGQLRCGAVGQAVGRGAEDPAVLMPVRMPLADGEQKGWCDQRVDRREFFTR